MGAALVVARRRSRSSPGAIVPHPTLCGHGTRRRLLDATAQAELVRTGQATLLELVDAAIERIERLNPQLNAVIHERFEKARGGPAPARSGRAVRAQGPRRLQRRRPYYGGTKFLRDHDWRPGHDSHLTAKFRPLD